MKIVLVRHGQTPANRLGALDTVRPGLGLTPEGLLQAQRLADRWESEVAPPPTVIALSGLHRTRLTAAPLASAYGLTPQVHPGIRELRSGDLEMAADPASQSLYVRTTLSWCAGDLDNRMPGGESGREALARSLETVRRVGLAARENAGDEAVAVFVIHGALTRLLATWLSTDIDEDLVSKHFMSNTGTSTFEWAPDFTPASADELAKGLHALTWNDRPLDQWS